MQLAAPVATEKKPIGLGAINMYTGPSIQDLRAAGRIAELAEKTFAAGDGLKAAGYMTDVLDLTEAPLAATHVGDAMLRLVDGGKPEHRDATWNALLGAREVIGRARQLATGSVLSRKHVGIGDKDKPVTLLAEAERLMTEADRGARELRNTGDQKLG